MIEISETVDTMSSVCTEFEIVFKEYFTQHKAHDDTKMIEDNEWICDDPLFRKKTTRTIFANTIPSAYIYCPNLIDYLNMALKYFNDKLGGNTNNNVVKYKLLPIKFQDINIVVFYNVCKNK
jgi:hypothetical protein